MSRCLVLGGGLLGSHVARHLADHGYTVSLLSRSLNPWFRPERRHGIEIVIGDIEKQPELLAELVMESDHVIHAASSTSPPFAERASKTVAQMIGPTLNVLQLLTCIPEKTFVLLSSGGTIYGDPSQLPTPEHHPLQATTSYAATHIAIEQQTQAYEKTHGLRVIRARLANIYGPGETGHAGQGVVGTWLRCLAASRKPVVVAPLSISRDFLYVDDAASAIAALLERGTTGLAYNVGSGTTTSLQEVLETISEVTGIAIKPKVLKAEAQHTTGSIRATMLDTERIRTHTMWHPTVSFSEGVRRAWEWVRTEGVHLHRSISIPSPQAAAAASEASP